MASRGHQRRTQDSADGSTVKRICSINSTGVVFVNTALLEVSTDLTLTVQTCALGLTREWSVHGWVVECSRMRGEEGSGYQVTLLFSNLPEGLQQVLALAEEQAKHAYPAVEGAELFGLN